MSSQILYAEVSTVCVLFLILIAIKTKKSVFLQSQRYLFLMVIISNMTLFILDAIWIFVDSKALPISLTMNWLLNGAYYALSGLVGYICFCFSENIQRSRFSYDKRYQIAALLPAAILIILTIFSYQNQLLFYIDANNQYQRGPLYSVQVILSYGYVFFTAIHALIHSFRTKGYRRKIELRSLAFFAVPSIIAGMIQVFFPHYPVLCVGTTFAIMYVYSTEQEQLISLDALTQLNNRSQLFQYLSGKLGHNQKEKSLYLLIIDVNKFKSINDRYGHIEGDRALKLVADSLRKVCSQQNYFVSRYGGDEFIVVCELSVGQSIQNVCEAIHADLRTIEVPYSLTVSIGYAKYSDNIKSQQEFIALADKELYAIKNQNR